MFLRLMWTSPVLQRGQIMAILSWAADELLYPTGGGVVAGKFYCHKTDLSHPHNDPSPT